MARLVDVNGSNQGRVRSDSVAQLEYRGLRFRSRAEISLYRALAQRPIVVAPLPVFVQGGAVPRRFEPDFFVVVDGLMLVVEVDGPHHDESPVEAQERVAPLATEGVHIHRMRAGEVDTPERAQCAVARLMKLVAKLRRLR